MIEVIKMFLKRIRKFINRNFADIIISMLILASLSIPLNILTFLGFLSMETFRVIGLAVSVIPIIIVLLLYLLA